MGNVEVLAKNQGVGAIYRMPCGIININISGVTIHLTEEAFMDASEIILESRSKILEMGLQKIIKETES